MSIRIKTTLKQYQQCRKDILSTKFLGSFPQLLYLKSGMQFMWNTILTTIQVPIYDIIWQNQLWSFKFECTKLDEMSAKYI